ncbi:MAG TPA: hypothetical protein VIJ51_05450 [Solirubrobacteraceae bacterium]
MSAPAGIGRELLLVLALVSLGGASLRLAARLGADGLERVVAAAPIATSIAVLEAIGLGLFSLGSSSWTLTVAAVLTWGFVWLATGGHGGSADPGVADAAAAWWTARSRSEQLITGLAIGLWGAACAWIVRNPMISLDAAVYHLNDVAAWVHNGRPGSNVNLSYDIPFGSYPLVDEVARAWLAGISRGFAAPTLWTPALYMLLIAAGWVGLRALRVPRAVAGLCLATVATVPVLLQQVPLAGTDLPGLSWLAVCAALVACSAKRPRLFGAALLAAGLAVGTKTTPVPLVIVALAAGVWFHRGRLRELAPNLAPAVLVAGVLGGLWYVRDFVEHGSPLWPFLSLPGSDPTPNYFVLVRPSFLSRPLATIHGPGKVYRDAYTWQIGGAWVLLAGGLLAPLLRRKREILAAAAAVGLGLLGYANAPLTGATTDPALWLNTAGTNRYVLPVLVAAGLAIGLLGRTRGLPRTAALGVLSLGLLVNLAAATKYVPTSIELPPLSYATLGAVAGVLGVLGAGVAAQRQPGRLIVGGAGLVACVALALALASGSDGFLARSVVNAPFAGPIDWFDAQPGYVHGSAPIAMADLSMATLAGDRYQHPLELIPADASCPAVRARARRGWVVVTTSPFPGFRQFTAARCLASLRPLETDEELTVYGPGS